ncbi:MAG: hypothetical protein QOH64_3096 [Acidimicrobiaceae bacterium]|jgi:hypothetical protein
MATDPPPDLVLAPLTGEPRTVDEWVTLFVLGLVVLDPFTYESAWLLEEAGRILESYAPADVRVGFIVTGTADEARQFLGPWVDRLLAFSDPERAAVKAMGLTSLPAFLVVDMAGKIAEAAEGWHPDEWRAVAAHLATLLSWTRPTIPGDKAPGPYDGSPALA